MRGSEREQGAMFSYVSIEDRIPADHPLRKMRAMVDPLLRELSPRFAELYADHGRPSIPPEQLLRALLLQVLYTVRSERQLMEQLDYNLLFRWFVGLELDDPIWHPTTFTKNRDRLLDGSIAEAFLAGVVRDADRRGFLSRDHFTVDGTLLEAWASQKSVRPLDVSAGDAGDPGDPGSTPPRNPTVNFHGEARSNATHRSKSDPDARLAKKGPGKETKLSHQASALMENRHGLIVQTRVGIATGRAEVEQAEEMLCALAVARPSRAPQGTVGADKRYDEQGFIKVVRDLGFTPHVAQHSHSRRRSRLDGRTTRHPGYATSQRRRKMIEESFGWAKTVGLLRKLRHRGTDLVDWVFSFTMAAYNLVRMRTIIQARATT